MATILIILKPQLVKLVFLIKIQVFMVFQQFIPFLVIFQVPFFIKIQVFMVIQQNLILLIILTLQHSIVINLLLYQDFNLLLLLIIFDLGLQFLLLIYI